MRAALFTLLLALAPWVVHAQETAPLLHPGWSFEGPFGTFDRAALQRGFQIYREVCSSCHSMNLLHYRDLSRIGLDEAQIKAMAASVTVEGGVNASGQPVSRPGLPSDRFRNPWPNEQAAKAAFNGAVPPDLSLIVNARAGGPNYVYSLLNGFRPAPVGIKLAPGRYYNIYFPGHQIGMPPPLTPGRVTYADGTKATVPQMAHDVVTYLAWAANPEMETRKRMGVHVVLFLTLLLGLTYAVKRKVWAKVH